MVVLVGSLCCNQQGEDRQPWAFSNAEKQQRYRERHLGLRGKKARVQLILSIAACAQLRRLARRKGHTVTKLIEELATSAERRTVAQLSPQALKSYYSGYGITKRKRRPPRRTRRRRQASR